MPQFVRQSAMPSVVTKSLISEQVERVLASAETFVRTHATTGAQQRAMQTAADGLRLKIERVDRGFHPALFFAHMPLVVYAGLRGNPDPAIPLAAATTLFALGIDLLDDVADGDQPYGWSGATDGEINLAAVTLLSALAPLAIAELQAPAAVVSAMQRTLADGLLHMCAGQQLDLAMTGTAGVRANEVEASVVGKSGAQLATFTRLAAQFAEGPPAVVDGYGELGRAIASACQLSSDCFELLHDPAGRDFANGARTLPLALHLERLNGADQSAFQKLLEQARTDESARQMVRALVRTSGALRHAVFVVEIYCQKARHLCNRLAPLEPARSALRSVIDCLTFFPEDTHEPRRRQDAD